MHKIADKGPLAITAAKKCLDASRTMSVEEGNVLEADLMKELAATKDVAEGIGAMLAKRKPVFSGE